MNLFLPVLILFVPQSANTGEIVIPLTDQPANFSGAAGVYIMEVAAAPTSVNVEEPITLSVKVRSTQPGPLSYTPQRDKLHLFPSQMENDFFIEPLPEEDRFVASENTWEFHWRLMPKHDRVNRIPPLEFVYYQSTAPSGFKAADGSHSIALEVKPRSLLQLTSSAARREQFRTIVEGPSVLGSSMSQQQLFRTVAIGLALPPLVCFAGYFGWRRLFPEAAERLRRRRGRAFRHAISRLRRLDKPAPEVVRSISADYLRHRFDLHEGEPTPLEVKETLQKNGMPTELSSKVEVFFKDCDAALFAPNLAIRADELRSIAQQLIQDLESAQCASLKK